MVAVRLDVQKWVRRSSPDKRVFSTRYATPCGVRKGYLSRTLGAFDAALACDHFLHVSSTYPKKPNIRRPVEVVVSIAAPSPASTFSPMPRPVSRSKGRLMLIMSFACVL